MSDDVLIDLRARAITWKKAAAADLEKAKRLEAAGYYAEARKFKDDARAHRALARQTRELAERVSGSVS